MVSIADLRVKARGAARVVRFGAGVLWAASPFLSLTFVALALVPGLVPALQIWATEHLVDSLTARTVASRDFVSLLTPVLPWLGVLVATLIITDLVNSVGPLLTVHFTERLNETAERRVLEKILRLELALFESPKYYDALERAGGAGRAVQVISSLQEALGYLLGMVSVGVMLARANVPLTLLLALGSVPILLLTTRESSAFERLNYEQSPLQRRLAYWRSLSTKRESATELRLFQLGGYFVRRWREIRQQLTKEMFALRWKFARTWLPAAWATQALSGIVIVGLVYSTSRGHLSLGALVALLYGVDQFSDFRQRLGFSSQRLVWDFAALRNLSEFMDLAGKERSGGAPAPPLKDGIRFENVGFQYPGANQPALLDVNLHIQPGQRIALVGENGAGKSTLARLLLGLYRPTQGRILVDGVDLADIDPMAWRKQAAAAFQEFVRYQLTVRENIGLADVRTLTHDDQIIAAARTSGAHAFIETLPAAYETLLGKGFDGAHDLSVGQWQKLALARSYLRCARVLVLDEPTAALDALAEMEVYRQFSIASKGRTVILISHRLGSARLADLIVFLEQGRIVQYGSHDELLASGGPYADMYALQAEWYRDSPAAPVQEVQVRGVTSDTERGEGLK